MVFLILGLLGMLGLMLLAELGRFIIELGIKTNAIVTEIGILVALVSIIGIVVLIVVSLYLFLGI